MVQEFDELVTQFGEAGATVLDGEMLIHASTQRLTFLVFDMYCFQGRSICSEKLSERLKGVRDFIGSYRQVREVLIWFAYGSRGEVVTPA